MGFGAGLLWSRVGGKLTRRKVYGRISMPSTLLVRLPASTTSAASPYPSESPRTAPAQYCAAGANTIVLGLVDTPTPARFSRKVLLVLLHPYHLPQVKEVGISKILDKNWANSSIIFTFCPLFFRGGSCDNKGYV